MTNRQKKSHLKILLGWSRLQYSMAITAMTNCLGPPPLPPGKRFLQRSKKLSSTYKSFHDPAVEAWLPHGILESPMAKLRPCETAVGTILAKQGLFRSCSEGDLRSRKTTAALAPSNTPLEKCIKTIYGSWKNLLHRKCADRTGLRTVLEIKRKCRTVVSIRRHYFDRDTYTRC